MRSPVRTSSCAGLLFGVFIAVSACSGSDGDQGPAGADGSDGKDGVDGAPGKDGVDGAPGKDGAPGADGPTGAPGADGPKGDSGEDGDPGAMGLPGENGDDAASRSLSFRDVGFPVTNAEKHRSRASQVATLNGKDVAIDYHVILRGNQDPSQPNKACDLAASPDTCFGAILAANGDPLLDGAGEPIVAASHDFTSFLEVGGNKFMVNAFESNPSAMFVSAISQDAAGALSATSTKAIDLSPIDGMWFSCAGMVTPWKTHLASEEFPPDARFVQAQASWADLKANATSPSFDEYKLAAQYWGIDLTDANEDGLPDGDYQDFLDVFTPHFHGFAVEVTLAANGAPSLKKHYAMGRHSLEVPRVMPDNKTVILTDDGANVGLFMFVADTAGDLSAGDLYAMRAYQTTPAGGDFRADIGWISLGHATNAEVKGLLHPASGPRISFSDIFEVAAPVAGICADAAFKAVRGANSDALECLKLKPGMELAASRLETRRYAALLGATTEINKEEGSAYDPTRNTLYVALSDVTIGMLAPTGGFGADHINVKSNRCGGVWALDVGPYTTSAGKVISEYAPLNWRPVIVGTETTYPADSPYFGNTCSINGLASPDNVTFLPGYDLLVIGEDTSRHQNDAVWSYHVVTGKLTRIMTTPYGSETTSPYWFPNLGGFGYLMSVVQHPYGESDQARVSDAESTGPESWVGVIGPFPPLD